MITIMGACAYGKNRRMDKVKKKLFQLLALFLACAVLAVLYTDRDANRWTFSGETLGQILVSGEEADSAEAEAQTEWDEAQARARALAEAGEWSRAEKLRASDVFKPAVDEAGGLNLMWGSFSAEITYASPAPLEFRVVSAGRQSFVKGGAFRAAAGEGTLSHAFELTDSAARVRLACDLPEGAEVSGVTVRRTGVLLSDRAAYALLLAAILTLLLVLSWDERPGARERRRDALMVILTAAFAGMPLFWGGLFGGTDHDLFFHLNRIEGIAAGLRCGQFPVRLHASTLLGYGYAAPIFYPEIFLYLPAVLRNLGVSLAGSWRIALMLINLAVAAASYAGAKHIFGNSRAAVGSCMLYTLCIYRLATLYTRAAIGESLAMIFFPLLIAAMVDVLLHDESRWPLLAAGMTGIALCHLLSTLFAVLLCAAAALCVLVKLFKEPRRILAIMKAAGVTALCVLFFYVPMLSYKLAGVSADVALDTADNVLQMGSFLVGFSGEAGALPEDFAYTIGVVPGLAMLIGCGLLIVRRYADGKSFCDKENDRLSFFFIGLAGLCLLAATDLFPWVFLCGLPRPFSTFFMQIQFPWRLVGMAAPLLALAGAWGYLREEKHAAAGMALLTVLCAVFAGYTMQCFVQDTPVLRADGFCDTRIPQYEYTYVGTEKEALRPGEIRVANSGVPAKISDFEKRGSELSFTLEADGGSYIEVPLLYYPGYEAEIDGQPHTVSLGENNVLRIYGGVNGTGRVTVHYEEPLLWRVSELASLAGLALLIASLCRMKRAKR